MKTFSLLFNLSGIVSIFLLFPSYTAMGELEKYDSDWYLLVVILVISGILLGLGILKLIAIFNPSLYKARNNNQHGLIHTIPFLTLLAIFATGVYINTNLATLYDFHEFKVNRMGKSNPTKSRQLPTYWLFITNHKGEQLRIEFEQEIAEHYATIGSIPVVEFKGSLGFNFYEYDFRYELP